jgi:hypothetical protein
MAGILLSRPFILFSEASPSTATHSEPFGDTGDWAATHSEPFADCGEWVTRFRGAPTAPATLCRGAGAPLEAPENAKKTSGQATLKELTEVGLLAV